MAPLICILQCKKQSPFSMLLFYYSNLEEQSWQQKPGNKQKTVHQHELDKKKQLSDTIISRKKIVSSIPLSRNKLPR